MSTLKKTIQNLNHIFLGLNEDEIKNIIQKSHIKKYQKGEIILNKDNCTDALCLLLEGIIHIGYLSPSGRFHAFHYYSEKSLLNLMPCIKNESLDYDYYAFNQVRILQIPRELFLAELNKNKDLSNGVLGLMAQRMHNLLNEIKFLHVANLHQKVCKILFDLAQQYGRIHQLGTEIEIKISQHDLADLLSSSRQTINKEIKNLVSQNVIKWQYENIIIKNKDYLKYQINGI
jgi:CRP/FNR family transcriptional regulator, cyclic AMP receptor protein